MTTKMTSIPNEEIIQNAQRWLQSTAGQETIQNALQEAKIITTRLQEESRVDVKTLHEPFTV